MLKTCSTAAALALIAVLAAPADAQSPPSWTQAGMLRCVVNPSIGFISRRPPVDGVHLHPERANPAAGLLGALNMIGLNIGISAGGVFGLGGVSTDGWDTGRSARWRICRRQRGHRPRPRRRRQRPESGVRRGHSRCSLSHWRARLPSTLPLASPRSN